MDYYDYINDYLNESLTEVKKKGFEDAMDRDPILRQAVADHDVALVIMDSLIEKEVRDEIQKSISESNDEVEKTNDEHELEDESDSSDSAQRKSIAWKWILLLLVGVLLAWFIISSFFASSSKNKMYASTYREPAWPLERAETDSKIAEPISMYFSGNQQKAKAQLKSMNQPISHFWLAELYMYEMKYDSVRYFAGLETNYGSQRERDRLNYLTILSEYMNEHYKEVKKLIDTLPPDTDKYYHKIYKTLLNNI